MDTSLNKLLWVAAPVLAAGAALAWWAWRGRLPSRQGLNVGFSLLLLAYVLTTAGLGIFWVANQQLPVFDWHYLFGYATVLLLLVHLAFNLPVVWRHLRRKGRTAARGTAPVAGGRARRPWLGAAGLGGVALAAGLGYMLGLRQGRTELQLDGPLGDSGSAPGTSEGNSAHGLRTSSASSGGTASSGGRDSARAWAVVQQFHTFSGHSRRRVLRHAASSDWGLAPPPFKRYHGAARIALPSPRVGRSAPAGGNAERDDSRQRALADLGSVLWHTTGISAWRGGIAFRTSPSSGALFATELYVLALDLSGLEAGPWHYDPEHHALQRLGGAGRPTQPAQPAPLAQPTQPALAPSLERFGPLARPRGCLALIVASALFARSGHKYGDRTYRYILADLGHALENLRVAARERCAWPMQLLSHFDEAAIGAALGLNARHEGVLAVAALGPPEAAMPQGSSMPMGQPGTASRAATHAIPGAQNRAAAQAAARPGSTDPWTSALTTESASGLPATLGLTEAMQAATSLHHLSPQPWRGRSGSAVQPATERAEQRSPATLGGSAAATGSAPAARAALSMHRLPRARPLGANWLRLIAERRSVRRFTTEPVSQQALADILAAMSSVPAQLSAAVRIDIVTAAAQGLPPAAWRVEPANGELQLRVLHGVPLRQRARAAALDQDVIGDAAIVFVLSLDIAQLHADAFGAARGYRHGFIEAGLIGERLYLAAGALGLGVCAVGAFYDDEAAALVGLDAAREWPVHFAALGVPA